MRTPLVPTPPLSIAPMMEKTDRHYRYFIRQITRCTLLYTEMVTTGAIIHGDRDHLLGFSEEEHPIALQLGGDDPEELYDSIRIAEQYGYDEYNLNVGCPSDRVQHRNFGACLMATPEHVRRLVAAMRSATAKPVTVKHRIGIDGRESYDEMKAFVETVNEAGPDRFTVHARIAILAGLSPRENRDIPPLRYEDVYRLKAELPELQIEINGGVHTLDEVATHLQYVDGVMIGRAVYDNPWMLRDADSRIFATAADLPAVANTATDSAATRPGPGPLPTREEVVASMIPYIRQWQELGWHPRAILRHMLGLFAYQPGARRFRQKLSGPMADDVDGAALLMEAIAQVPDRVLVA